MLKTRDSNKNQAIIDHLASNLENPVSIESLLSQKGKSTNLFSLSSGNYQNWANQFLNNTRLIIEPQFIGSPLILHYKNGSLIRALDINYINRAKRMPTISDFPLSIFLNSSIYIMGDLYSRSQSSKALKIFSKKSLVKSFSPKIDFRFCAYRIINSKLNHYQNIKALKMLSFEVPETEFTRYITDIEIFRELWLQSKIFDKYPTNGIVLKVNSRKLQKRLGSNKNGPLWAFSIKK